MIADRVARFRRTAGQVYLCSLTCNRDCYLRSSTTRVIVVEYRMSAGTPSRLPSRNETQYVSYPHFGDINEPSKIRTNDRISRDWSDQWFTWSTALSLLLEYTLFQNLTFPRKHLFAKAQYVRVHLEGKKSSLLLFTLWKIIPYYYLSSSDFTRRN